MKKILDFINKYGFLILILIGIGIIFNTCGGKGGVTTQSRRIDRLEKTIKSLDSTLSLKISSEKMDILLKINALEIAREVVYTNNAIVRTTTRPDDVINSYNNQIKELQEKLKNTK
jgi:hypothetical protein